LSKYEEFLKASICFLASEKEDDEPEELTFRKLARKWAETLFSILSEMLSQIPISQEGNSSFKH